MPRSLCSPGSKVAAQGSVHLTLLKSGARETVAYQEGAEASVSCCVLPCTWHSESTCRRTAKMPAFFFFFLIQGRVRFSLHPPSSPSFKVVIASQGNLSSFFFFFFFAACSYLPGKYICWRRLREELPPDLLLFPCEVFSSENPIVSELGWDLGLVPKGLSLGNEINKGYILVFQAL